MTAAPFSILCGRPLGGAAFAQLHLHLPFFFLLAVSVFSCDRALSGVVVDSSPLGHSVVVAHAEIQHVSLFRPHAVPRDHAHDYRQIL